MQSFSLLREFSFLRGPRSVLVRPSTDRMRPTHLMEGNLLHSRPADFSVNLYAKSTMVNAHHICKKPSQPCLDRCWTKQLGAITLPRRHTTLTMTGDDTDHVNQVYVPTGIVAFSENSHSEDRRQETYVREREGETLYLLA